MTINKPLVSIIIPNYNKEEYLKKTISSLLNQTYQNIEIIVIDDASSDHSRELINTLKDTNSKIITYLSDINQGVSKCRNIGIELAHGDYITTLDSDDIYYPQKIENEVRVLQSNNNIAGAFSNYNVINKTDQILREYCLPDRVEYDYMIRRGGILPRDIMYKNTKPYSDILFDENISLYEDWKFKLQISKKGILVNTNNPGIGYRQVDNGLSKKTKMKHIKSIFNILKQEIQSMYVYPVFGYVILNMIKVNGLQKIKARINYK